ncbi:MAG: hypothetical protein H0X46_04620, partial [Bacteroidetes bacterium]|nr:hypothetical protein [Bacteroidota bacterium]
MLNYVTVKASVTDDRKLTAVSITLLDADLKLVHTIVPIVASSPSITIDHQYFLDNVHLLTGIY